MSDDGGFDEWYRQVQPRLVASMMLTTGSAEDAQDAASEALTRALLHWNRVRTMESPDGWTFRVAFNLVRRRERRRGLERRLLHRAGPVTRLADGPAGEAWAIVRELPPRQRETIVLRYIADLTEPQIGAALGISRSAVASALSAAHLALRGQLEDPQTQTADATTRPSKLGTVPREATP